MQSNYDTAKDVSEYMSKVFHHRLANRTGVATLPDIPIPKSWMTDDFQQECGEIAECMVSALLQPSE